jgi:hypothetical protein
MIIEHEHQESGTSSTASNVKQQLRMAAEDAKETTKRTAADLKERYAQTVSECKDVNLADGVDMAARKVADLSEYLHNADLSALRHKTEDFTRRHPEGVYGGFFLAGFALARLLKASSGRPQEISPEDELEETYAEYASSSSSVGATGYGAQSEPESESSSASSGYESSGVGYAPPPKSGAAETPSSGTYGTSTTSGTLGSTGPSGITPQP